MGKISNQVNKAQELQKAPEKQNVNQIMASVLDGEKMRSRFDELLGKRAPQFISAMVSTVNGSPMLQQAMFQSPVSVVVAGLKAAAFDLPIDPTLGYAYIVPFKNNKKGGIMEAQFILGYKGMNQLALRTGQYKVINVVDIREGELKSYNRLTEEIELDFIEDEDVREAAAVIGYVGYFRLVNGAEKTIYMSVKKIQAHEKKHRKGQYMAPLWRDDFDSMARKTVFRKLIGKYGVMSIDYQNPAAQDVMSDALSSEFGDDQAAPIIDLPDTDVNPETGEVVEHDADQQQIQDTVADKEEQKA